MPSFNLCPTISTNSAAWIRSQEEAARKSRDYSLFPCLTQNNRTKSKQKLPLAEKAKTLVLRYRNNVHDYLVPTFEISYDYNFTSTSKRNLTSLPKSSSNGPRMIRKFYSSFHTKVKKLVTSKKNQRERLLEPRPGNGKPFLSKSDASTIGAIGDAMTETPVCQPGEKDRAWIPLH